MEMIKKLLLFSKAGKILCGGIALTISLSLVSAPVTAMAKVKDEAIYNADGIEDFQAEYAKRKKEPVQTNSIADWPQGPQIGAAGAVVMDADSGEILYGKNMYKHLYPASITKLMTALLTYENLDPSEHITFSENAVFGIESGSSNIGMDVGESITVEEALYGLLIASANEVAVALGEKVSGSEKDFAGLMNERARELGCENTNFVTLNGLHDRNHYTCAYDMALIARQIYAHTDLIKYMSDYNYHFEKSKNQPDDFWISNTNDFLTGQIICEDVIGGKTGYTDQARETLVTFAERDDVHLICVIMKEEPPHEYYDTIDLLEYAFDNFTKVNISKSENKYTLGAPAFLSFGPDIFGKSQPAYTIDHAASLMIPKNVSFSDLDSEIIPLTYESSSGQESGTASTGSADETDNRLKEQEKSQDESILLGKIHYRYHDYDLTTADVFFRPVQKKTDFSKSALSHENSDEGSSATGEKTGLSKGSGSEDNKGTDNKEGSENGTYSIKEEIQEEVHGIRSFFFNIVHTGAHGSIYVNILIVLPVLLTISFFLCVLFFINSYFARLKKRRMRRRRTVKKNIPGDIYENRRDRRDHTPDFRGR